MLEFSLQLLFGSIRYWRLVLLPQKQNAIVGVHIKKASTEINNANTPASFIFFYLDSRSTIILY